MTYNNVGAYISAAELAFLEIFFLKCVFFRDLSDGKKKFSKNLSKSVKNACFCYIFEKCDFLLFLKKCDFCPILVNFYDKQCLPSERS